MANVMAKKPLPVIMAEASETGEHSLKRALGPGNLISLGIGAIIGTGIFVLTGTATANHAGPAIILSFLAPTLMTPLTPCRCSEPNEVQSTPTTTPQAQSHPLKSNQDEQPNEDVASPQ